MHLNKKHYPSVCIDYPIQLSNIQHSDVSGLRSDGRQLRQAREFIIQPKIIDDSKGSVYIELGATKVLCVIYGPRENNRNNFYSNSGKLSCDFTFGHSSRDKLKNLQLTEEEKEISVHVENALSVCVQLDKYPKSVIDVKINVIQDDGGSFSAAIIAATAALGHSGIQMFDMGISTSVSIVSGKIMLDCCKKEENIQDGVMTIVYMPNMNKISYISQNGNLTADQIVLMYDIALDNCAQVYSSLRDSFQTRLSLS